MCIYVLAICHQQIIQYNKDNFSVTKMQKKKKGIGQILFHSTVYKKTNITHIAALTKV